MKIVFVNNMLKNGGAEVSLCRIANLLCNKNHSVSVITIAQEKNFTALLDNKIEYDFVISDSRRSNRMVNFLLRGFNFIKRPFTKVIMTYKLNRQKADVVITFNEFEKCLIPLIRCKAGKKICWFRHDITDNYICRRIIGAEKDKFISLFRDLDKLLFVTMSSMNNFCEHFPMFQKECEYFINSVDIREIHDFSKKEIIQRDNNKLIFLCLARLAKEKGQDLLFEAAQLIEQTEQKDNYEIWLIGGRSYNDFDYNPTGIINTDVKSLGFMDNPYPYLKAADVVVVPSRSEGCPNVILEAMALGKPIISTKTSGGVELLENGKYGLLCDINANSLFQAMIRMFDKSEYERYQRVSEEKGKTHTNEAFTDSLNTYLETLIKE